MYNVKTYYRKEELPPWKRAVFFIRPPDSTWYSNSPAYKPLMLVAFDADRPVAALFAVITALTAFSGKLFQRCFITQQPQFFEKNLSQIDVFEKLITHLVEEVKIRYFSSDMITWVMQYLATRISCK